MTNHEPRLDIVLSGLSDARAEDWERWGPSGGWAKILPGWGHMIPGDAGLAQVVQSGLEVASGSLPDRFDRVKERLATTDPKGPGGIQSIPIMDVRYPASLRSVPYPPWILHVRGNYPLLSTGIAIVGSREADESDLEAARTVAQWAAFNEIPVITGMARGVDREAVMAAVQAGGTVIGVSPGGPTQIIPKESKDAYDQATRSGCIVTEVTRLPRKHPWTPQTAFLRRNRIISGLARVVVVCSRKIKGGSFNQVVWAKRQGCPVIGYAPEPHGRSFPGPDRPLGRYHMVNPQNLGEKAGEVWNTRDHVVQESL